MKESELLAVMALQRSTQIGDILAKRLIKTCGSAEAIFRSKAKMLRTIDGIGQKLIADLFDSSNFRLAEQELRFIKDHGIDYCFFLGDDYPCRLKHCVDGPILLFQKGHIKWSDQPVISIVGTRQITSRGRDFCEHLVASLAPYNPIVVSGFAYGTDITAQQAAVNNNLQTIGCLAHGFDQIYPRPHKIYVERIMEHGGFYTDFWSIDDFERTNFLKRNRIIAGLSEVTIVIESAEKGGSLVTADIANSYDREVFAVPGRPEDIFSAGCNNLIKNHLAHMLTQPEDVPYLLDWPTPGKKEQQIKLFPELTSEEQRIYGFLGKHGKTELDSIALELDLPTFKVASVLLSLELKGIIRPLPGKAFESL
ncbi:MAG: DNA-protecting protein DprA [Flavobacteriaceae bacterium]|nr:DNA-protecting protein DprA [Flavobacteriaceae bacterium]